MRLRLGTPPTAQPDVGAARVALATWLQARRHDAHLTLRLEDLGPRPRPGHEDAAAHDFAWLGLDWDATQRQSDRGPRYAAAARRLEAAGRLYPCFESEEELRAKRDQRVRRKQAALYDRAMLKLTPAQRAEAEAGGKRPYWRFLLSGADVGWTDLVLGRQAVKLGAMSDPVLVRADGTPLPLFAGIVDDLDGHVTHVVRDGAELGQTGLALDIMAALGGRPNAVRFAHLPPLQGRRLPALRSLRADGIEPDALAGLLARLGTPDAPSAEPPALLASRFDLARIAPAPPLFETAALLALNRSVLGAMPFDVARDRLPPGATPAFWHAVRGGLDLMREARGWWDVACGMIAPPALEADAPYLEAALAALPAEPWDETTWGAWLDSSGRADGTALRLALTGEEEGPDLAPLLPLIGRRLATERLRAAAGVR